DAGPGYGTRANPSYWAKVFKAFPGLHVNMAHFGGFEEAFVDDKLQTKLLPKTWEWSSGKMVTASQNLPLYSDISYLSEVLNKESQERKDALACMRAFKKNFAD